MVLYADPECSPWPVVGRKKHDLSSYWTRDNETKICSDCFTAFSLTIRRLLHAQITRIKDKIEGEEEGTGVPWAVFCPSCLQLTSPAFALFFCLFVLLLLLLLHFLFTATIVDR